MRCAENVGIVDDPIDCENTYFSQFKFDRLQQKGVVAVIREEQNISYVVMKAVCLIQLLLFVHFNSYKIELSRTSNIQYFLQAYWECIGTKPTASHLLKQLDQLPYIDFNKMELTYNAVDSMLKQSKGSGVNYIVEVSKVKPAKDNFIRYQLYDGTIKLKSVYEVKNGKDLQKMAERNDGKLMIRVTQFLIHQYGNRKYIEVVDFDPIISAERQKQKQFNQLVNIKREQIDRKDGQEKKMVNQNGKIGGNTNYIKSLKIEYSGPQQLKYEQSNVIKAKFEKDAEETSCQRPRPAQILAQITDLSYFDKINELDPSNRGWELLARIICKEYKEFISKLGNPTQILTVELIDVSNLTIQATFFGQFAKYYQEILEKGAVYRMARGKLNQQKYKQNKSQKQSKYTIIFSKDCSICKVKNNPKIPLCSNNWSRLGSIAAAYSSQDQMQHTFLALLVSVQPLKQINKEGKVLLLQTLKIVDPITKIFAEVIIWNKQIDYNWDELVDKSILLRNFKITNFKGQFNLVSNFKSSIITHDFFKQYQGKFKPTAPTSSLPTHKYLKQLAQQLNIYGVQSATSEIKLWLTTINFSNKWNYDSCTNPKCKRSAVSHSICPHCGYRVQTCQKRLMLPLQFADFTGSIYTTAFQDMASLILCGIDMQALMNLSQKQLKQFGEHLCYREFKMNVISKKDNNGRINHSIRGKLEQIDTKEAIRANLQAINKLLADRNHSYDL